MRGSLPVHPLPNSRHDRGFGQEGLGRGVVLNAFDSDFVPSVIAQHHVCAECLGLFPDSPQSLGPSKGSRLPLLTSKLPLPNGLQQLQVLHIQRPATW